jgi:hypothetical protein
MGAGGEAMTPLLTIIDGSILLLTLFGVSNVQVITQVINPAFTCWAKVMSKYFPLILPLEYLPEGKNYQAFYLVFQPSKAWKLAYQDIPSRR